MSGDRNAKNQCCESEADRQPGFPSTHTRKEVSPWHPDFPNPTALASRLV